MHLPIQRRHGASSAPLASKYVETLLFTSGPFAPLESMAGMDALPDELVVIIGSSLSAVELTRFALLSRRFGLDRGEMTTKWKSPTFGFLVEYTAWSSLAEQSARRAVLYRPEFFRSKVSLWSWKRMLLTER